MQIPLTPHLLQSRQLNAPLFLLKNVLLPEHVD